MNKILMVSKPLVPPWDDSAKNIARDIVTALSGRRFNVLSDGRFSFGLPNLREEPLYQRDSGAYALGLWPRVKLFFRLLQPDELGLYHFFFAPNPMASRMAWLALQMKGYQKSLHTVCSAPLAGANLKKLLFADVTVAVSDATADRLRSETDKDVRLIYPGVAEVAVAEPEAKSAFRRELGLPEATTIALYAGDLEFSNAADTLVDALPEAMKSSDLHVVFCNRLKTERAMAKRETLREKVRSMKLENRVTFLGAQPSMDKLLHASEFQLMVPDSLYAKMDLPLVLLEGMVRGLPAIISDRPPLTEAFAGEKAGLSVPAGDAVALAAAICEMAEDVQLRKSCADAARSVAMERFSLEKMAAEYNVLYQEFD